jgi:hypothetical protein
MGCCVETYCIKEDVLIDGENLHAEVMEIKINKEAACCRERGALQC